MKSSIVKLFSTCSTFIKFVYVVVIWLSHNTLRIKQKDADQLKNEYTRLVEGLRNTKANRETDNVLTNPVIPNEVLDGK